MTLARYAWAARSMAATLGAAVGGYITDSCQPRPLRAVEAYPVDVHGHLLRRTGTGRRDPVVRVERSGLLLHREVHRAVRDLRVVPGAGGVVVDAVVDEHLDPARPPDDRIDVPLGEVTGHLLAVGLVAVAPVDGLGHRLLVGVRRLGEVELAVLRPAVGLRPQDQCLPVPGARLEPRAHLPHPEGLVARTPAPAQAAGNVAVAVR